MDTVETAFARNMQQHGWWTKSKEFAETQEQKHEVDIIAYNPKTQKMLYGNLTHLSHDADDSTLIV